jgi:hypothetical protein
VSDSRGEFLEDALVFFLLGVTAYRLLDLFTYYLKFEQVISRVPLGLRRSDGYRRQLKAVRQISKANDKSPSWWETRRYVRRYLKIAGIIDSYDIYIAYGALFMFASFGAVIFIAGGCDYNQDEVTKYVLAATTTIIAVPLSYFGYLIESFKLQSDRIL